MCFYVATPDMRGSRDNFVGLPQHVTTCEPSGNGAGVPQNYRQVKGTRFLRALSSSLGGSDDRLAVLLLCLLSACCLLAADLYANRIMPWLLIKTCAAKHTDIFKQTLDGKLWLLTYAGMMSFVAAVLAVFVPVRRWSLPVLLGLVFVLSAAVRISTPNMALDLMPKPDGSYYAALADSLIHGSWLVPVGGNHLVSRFSPGTSFVLLLTQWMQPERLAFGVTAIFLCGLATIGLTYYAGRTFFSKPVGIVAALLVATSPIHGNYSREIMSEVPWGLLILAAVVLLFHPVEEGRRRFWGGVLLGLGMLFKPPHIVVIAAVGAVLLWQVIRRPSTFRTLALPAGLGLALGLLPWLLYNKFLWGVWLTSGYNQYDTNRYTIQTVFGAQYLFGPPIEKGSFGNLPYYLFAFLGLDPRTDRMPWIPPVALLVGYGLVCRLRSQLTFDIAPHARKFVATTWATCLAFTGLFLIYFYQDSRFLLPILPLFFLLAAIPATAILFRMTPIWRNLLASMAIISQSAIALSIAQEESNEWRMSELTRLQILRAAHQNFDVIVTDEDPVLLSLTEVWTKEHPCIPFLPAGEDWFPDDPVAHRRECGTYMETYRGSLPVVRNLLRQGRTVCLWVRWPYLYPELTEAFQKEFLLTPTPNAGLTGLQEVKLRPHPQSGNNGPEK